MPKLNLNQNKVIKTLIASDILILSSFALINPIFAIFVTTQLPGAGLENVGFAVTIFLMTKALLQVPLAQVLDKTDGETDDFVAVFIGSLLISSVPFAYIFVDTITKLYLVQLMYGIGAALVYPAWNALFTRHIDSEHVSVEWGVYSTLTGLGAAVSAALGGVLAQNYGFQALFGVVGLTCLVGSGLLLFFFDDLKAEEEERQK